MTMFIGQVTAHRAVQPPPCREERPSRQLPPCRLMCAYMFTQGLQCSSFLGNIFSSLSRK